MRSRLLSLRLKAEVEVCLFFQAGCCGFIIKVFLGQGLGFFAAPRTTTGGRPRGGVATYGVDIYFNPPPLVHSENINFSWKIPGISGVFGRNF